MASGREIRISITSALNAAGIEATRQQVDQMAKSVKSSMASAAAGNKKHWADIKAAWDMGCAAIRKAWQAASAGLRSAFHFETQTTQFKTLIGNIDEARAHMADLKALGDTPPFSLDEFAKASRSLMVMTDGALGYKKSLELIGDAAAATGHPIEEMGQAVGRLYAFIRDGQPLSRAVMQLRNMGVITPEVAQKLQDLQAAGKSTTEIWKEVEAQLGRYKGAMQETEKTGEGLVGAIKTRWDNAVRAFGQALQEDAKAGLTDVLDAAKELEENGTLDVWASAAVDKIHEVIEACKAVGSAIQWVWEKSGASDLYHAGMAQIKGTTYAVTRTAAGLANGEGWGAIKNGWVEGGQVHDKEMAKGYYMKQLAEGGYLGAGMKWAAQDNAAEDAYEEEKKAKAGEKVRKRRAAEQAKQAEREAAEKKRLEESLADGQKKIDEKNAKEKAEKEAKAKEEAAKKAAAAQEKLDQQAAAARERQIQKELDQKIKAHQKLMAEEQKAENDARGAVSKAESKLQQAWGWYRDKDSMKAQLEEEKADAAAQKQYEKDFEKLKSKRRDWRKAENLSVDEEAVRRVALAKEEKEAAEKHLAEIEKNTADLAQKLDELLQVKG